MKHIIVRITDKQMKEYLEWLKKPEGAYFQMNFASAYGLVDVQFPVVRGFGIRK